MTDATVLHEVERAPAVAGPETPRGSLPPPRQPLTQEQMQAITAARQRARKVRRASGVAAFSGWTLAFFAAVSILSGIFSLRALFGCRR